MDPDTTLAEIRQILRDPDGDHGRLHHLVDSLDNWMSMGGFMPKVWDQARQARLTRDAAAEATAEITARHQL